MSKHMVRTRVDDGNNGGIHSDCALYPVCAPNFCPGRELTTSAVFPAFCSPDGPVRRLFASSSALSLIETETVKYCLCASRGSRRRATCFPYQVKFRQCTLPVRSRSIAQLIRK